MFDLCAVTSVFYLLSVLAIGEGAINAPVTQETPVRLAKPRPKTSEAPPPRKHHQINPVRLGIKEPPDGSFIQGSTVYVKLDLITHMDKDEFHTAYKNSKVCLSLDDSNYFCWPLSSTIMFSNTVDGSHTLQAKLYHNGNLLDATSSEEIMFTTISDPTMADEDVEYHSQSPVWNTEELQDEVIDLDQIDDEEDEEGTDVSFPQIQLLTPMHKVSYSGTEVLLDTLVTPADPDVFNKFFRRAYTCFNIDMATAHFCFPLFQEEKPVAVGLDIGFHTLETSLSNPETGELLEASSSGTQVFFMAGNDNEGAAFTAEMNLRGKLHRIPVVMGGCIAQQSKSLCLSVGLEHNVACVGPVFDHLRMIASQVGFFTGSSGTTSVIQGGS